MGRKSARSIGERNGGLEILEIMPGKGSGKHAILKCRCHFCGNKDHLISTGIFQKMNSCGCQQNNTSTWKSIGAKTRPWQLEHGKAARNNLLFQYKRGAKTRGLSFELTEEQFLQLVTSCCVYCKDSLTGKMKGQGKTSGDFLYTGIDRVDSKKGYTLENSVPCCWKCNNMKGKLSVSEFLDHVRKIQIINQKVLDKSCGF